MSSHFQMTLPSCGALLGLRIDDDDNLEAGGSVIVIFKGEGDRSVSPTIVLDDSEQPVEDTIVL